MAGDWIKWEVGLARKVEVITIASILGLDRRHVAGVLMELWEWADSNVTDVSRNECDSDDAFVVLRGDALPLVDGLVGVPGLADSMVSVGWLRLRDGRLEFPNLYRHNGKPGKHRALDARRQAVRRQKIKTAEGSSVTETSRDKRDIIVTREEKSRGENKRKDEALRSVPNNKPNHNLSARPLTRSGSDAIDWFARFWDAYPKERRRNRTKMENTWRTRKLNAKAELILERLEQHKSSDQWKRGIIPLIATWINQEAWEQDLGSDDSPVDGFTWSPAPVSDELHRLATSPLTDEERQVLAQVPAIAGDGRDSA